MRDFLLFLALIAGTVIGTVAVLVIWHLMASAIGVPDLIGILLERL